MLQPHRLTRVLGLIAALSLLAGPAAGLASAQSEQSTRIAIVDIQQVFNSLEEKTAIEADLRTRTQELQEKEEQRQKELQQLQSDLEILAKDSPAYKQKMEQLEMGAIELQAWRQFETKKLNRERALQIERLYNETLETIGSVAEENGYDLVLYQEQKPDFSGVKPEQIGGAIASRKVLWASDALELTEQVITRMNNEYESR